MTLVFSLFCAYAVIRFFGLAMGDATKAYCGVMFWFYMAFILLIPGTHQIATDTFPWPVSHSATDLPLACALIALGLVAFEVGYRAVPLGIRKRTVPPIAPSLPSETTATPVIYSALITTLFCFYLFNRFGTDWFLQSRGSLNDAAYARLNLTQIGMTIQLGRGLALSSLLIALLYIRRRASSLKRDPLSALLACSLLLVLVSLNAVVNFPGALPRFFLFGSLLTCAFVALPLASRGARLLLFGSAPLLIYTAFPLARRITEGRVYNFGAQLATPGTSLNSVDFDGMQQLLNTVSYVSTNGHTLGHQFLSAALFFVPRSTWDGKAVHTGALVGAEAGYDFLNLSASLFSELYVDFSWAGVVVGFFLLGRLLHAADQTMETDNSFAPFLICAIGAGFLSILLRGALLGIIAPVVSVAFGVLLASFVASLASLFFRDRPPTPLLPWPRRRLPDRRRSPTGHPTVSLLRSRTANDGSFHP